MPRINGERLLATLRRFAQFGAYRTGVHRPTYSDADMAARHWLVEQYRQLGLDAHIDGVGNVFGHPRTARRSLLVGSHAESQNHAGWLDGAMGVIFALELARSFAETPDCAGLPIANVAWADEESHFIPLLGSRSYIGALDEADLDAARNRDDATPLRDALRRAGLAGLPRAVAEPGRHLGYLEAHIEQGDSLEAAGLRLGVVTGIVGIWQYSITFAGVQNHAGTTRMAIRKDAGLAAARLACAIADRFPAVAAARSVWTTGRVVLHPGAPAIIPGRAEMLFQIRDEDPAVLAGLDAELHRIADAVAAASGCGVEVSRTITAAPLPMDASFQDAIENAAARHCPAGSIRMPSGAGHDAQNIGRIMPAGMLFVPSIGGISHHWTENTADDDLVLGCQVLADAAESLLRQQPG